MAGPGVLLGQELRHDLLQAVEGAKQQVPLEARAQAAPVHSNASDHEILEPHLQAMPQPRHQFVQLAEPRVGRREPLQGVLILGEIPQGVKQVPGVYRAGQRRLDPIVDPARDAERRLRLVEFPPHHGPAVDVLAQESPRVDQHQRTGQGHEKPRVPLVDAGRRVVAVSLDDDLDQGVARVPVGNQHLANLLVLARREEPAGTGPEFVQQPLRPAFEPLEVRGDVEDGGDGRVDVRGWHASGPRWRVRDRSPPPV